MSSALQFDSMVAAGMTASAVLAIVVPVALAIVVRKRAKASWRALGLGSLAFIVAQPLLRLSWQVPLAARLAPKFEEDPVLFYLFLAFSSLTAALFEEPARWVAMRWGLKKRDTGEAVMMGVGHGGIESILLVGLPLAANVVVYWLLASGSTLGMDPATHEALVGKFAEVTRVTAFLGGYERLLAIALHIALSVLVFQSFRLGGARYVWVAIGLHTLANLAMGAVAKLVDPVASEAVGTMMVIGTWYFALSLMRRPLPAPKEG